MKTCFCYLVALEVLLVVLFTCVEEVVFAQILKVVLVVRYHLVDVRI